MSNVKDAARCLIEDRGFIVPEQDFSDVMKAAQGLAAAVQAQSALMPDAGHGIPFEACLQAWAAPEIMPAKQGPQAVLPSAQAQVTASLDRIEQSDLDALAWRKVFTQQALADAQALDQEAQAGQGRGPLHGMPIGVKDMFDLKGEVARYGSILREDAAPAVQDASVVRKLKEAGAIVLGVQHMAEFAMSPTGLNVNLGPGQNPWNTEYVSGGSSSGAGMSVAAGHVRVALGSDTGGSVRLPAGFCGATGLKPTQYRISLEGAMPLSPNLDCVGPIGRTAQDCAAAYFAMTCSVPEAAMRANLAGYDVKLKVAVPAFQEGPLVSANVLQVLKDAVDVLRLMDVEVISVPMPDLDTLGKLASVVLATESAAIHRFSLQAHPDAYGRQVRRRLSRGLFVSSMDYYDALRLRAPLLQAFMQDTLNGAQALLLPLAPDVAPRISDTVGEDEATLEARFSNLSYWTRGINYLGLPALALPAGIGKAQLPLAVQFVGAPFSEAQLLVLGHRFQQHTQWHQRIPRAAGCAEVM